MPGFEDWDLWLRIIKEGYGILSLSSCTAAALVNEKHRKRRRGIRYTANEINFYVNQVVERRIGGGVALIALLIRIPWRLLPRSVLEVWMKSRFRSSPSVKAAWITESLTNKSGQTFREEQ